MGADNTFALPFYEKLATHYGSGRQYEQAERAFIKAGRPQRAVEMYVTAGQYEKGHKVAKAHMSPHEMAQLYISLAETLESQNKLSDAEHMYIIVQEFDQAINMYKKREEYEQMLRLVSKYRKELLNDTYKHIAEQFECKGNLKKAEHYYVEAKMWTSAMSMYRQLEKWEDAKRVAKFHGGKQSFEKVVLAQARATFEEHGAEAGAQLLAKHGLIEIAIDYAVEHSNFQHAFELATHSAKHKLPDIHLKKALALEDNEEFKAAEEEFIAAKKPKEAIDMYVHQHDFTSAMRVAENYDRDSVKEVHVAHAKELVDQNNLQGAENLFIQAGKPEMAVQAYCTKRMANEAVRVCKKHCPHMLADVLDSCGGENPGNPQPGPEPGRGPGCGEDLRGDWQLLPGHRYVPVHQRDDVCGPGQAGGGLGERSAAGDEARRGAVQRHRRDRGEAPEDHPPLRGRRGALREHRGREGGCELLHRGRGLGEGSAAGPAAVPRDAARRGRPLQERLG
eukprot:SRR837773.13511.p2 GENE.SRR837773.13511~~SRR837773.13511.p2  ORF type:complete len:553 (-),score=239.92 SRR837773.13511:670-2187(-)